MHIQVMNNPQRISVVVIGLNEEARLAQSLTAVFANCPVGYELEVFYVDSGSKDRSVAIAQSIAGVQVLQLQTDKPSAAKARNLGLRHATGQFVQLIDGDSVMQTGWMEHALQAIEKTQVACVFGQCIEMFPEQSIYMRACSFDWHIPPGYSRLCGGNSFWRLAVLQQHGFFDEALRCGEEPDLCYRVRQSGWRIVCLDVPMVLHDLAMTTFGQYWRRGVVNGRAYASIAKRYRQQPEKMWLKETVRNFAEPLVWLAVGALGLGVAAGAGAIVALLGWWSVRAARIAWSVRTRATSLGSAFLYGLHCQFMRLPAAVGQFQQLRAEHAL
ncbi:glycosyltransferase [Curvibacter sp. CHRR-16]|uniref:glycosyltransferase family 2 protein n=1 Tax=Curvibacter sp. CHRR-16 TaxID=2835872 RepID=UPI001BD99011|nr:glycosyltransferase [Curvibacter sp. CHRR-16]MBT0571525.1 glycosyltransferase [Curvibacter sp. CHRR-16]